VYFTELPVFPVPLLESGGVFLVVLGGGFMVISGFAPGSVLVWYTVTYGTIRFILEYLRGDPARPYLWNLSEAQWTTLVLLGAILILSLSGWLPLFAWHAWIVGGLMLLAVFTVFSHRIGKNLNYTLLRPRHVHEIAQGIEKLSVQHPLAVNQQMRSVSVINTSSGWVLSSGFIREHHNTIHHYTLSSNRGSFVVTDKVARMIADLLTRIRHHDHSCKIVSNNNGIHHIMFQKKQHQPT
jgi:hypothetical protein